MDEGSDTFSDNEYNNTRRNRRMPSIWPLNKGVSDFNNSRNNFVVNGQLEIFPIGELSGVSKAVLGGWQLGGHLSRSTPGEPFSVRLSSDRAFYRATVEPTAAAGGQRTELQSWTGLFGQIPSITGQPLKLHQPELLSPSRHRGELGNLGRNTPGAHPNMFDVDSSLFKNIPAGSRQIQPATPGRSVQRL